MIMMMLVFLKVQPSPIYDLPFTRVKNIPVLLLSYVHSNDLHSSWYLKLPYVQYMYMWSGANSRTYKSTGGGHSGLKYSDYGQAKFPKQINYA